MVSESFVILPKPPTGFMQDSVQANSIRLKWNPPQSDNQISYKYRITFQAKDPAVQAKLKVEEGIKETESNNFQLKLPEPAEVYEISIETLILLSGKNYFSEPLKKEFCTKPLPPEKLDVSHAGECLFIWKRSMSKRVDKYKFKIKKEDGKAMDYVVEDKDKDYDVVEDNEVMFKVPDMEVGIEYKVNIFSIVEHDGELLESEPLHEKVKLDHIEDIVGEKQFRLLIRKATDVHLKSRKSFQKSANKSRGPSRKHSIDHGFFPESAPGYNDTITEAGLKRLAALKSPPPTRNLGNLDEVLNDFKSPPVSAPTSRKVSVSSGALGDLFNPEQ